MPAIFPLGFALTLEIGGKVAVQVEVGLKLRRGMGVKVGIQSRMYETDMKAGSGGGRRKWE
jgi:hypothetical protein